MKLRTFVVFLYAAAILAPALAGNVDPSYRGYVKTVSVRSGKQEKAAVKQLKVRTQQYNKNYSSGLRVYVEVTDANGTTYFGSTQAQASTMRIDTWTQAEWLFDLKTAQLVKPEVTGYAVQHVATERDEVLDEKLDGAKSVDELTEQNKASSPLVVKFVSYDLLGN